MSSSEIQKFFLYYDVEESIGSDQLTENINWTQTHHHIWHLEDSEDKYDSTTNHIPLGAAGDVAFVSGMVGKGIKIGGGVNQFLVGPSLDLADPLSVSGWFKVDSFTINDQVILAQGDDGFKIHREANTNEISFSYTIAPATQIKITCTGVDLLDESWHHFVAEYNQVTGGAFYLDGNLCGADATTGLLNTNDKKLYVGSNVDDSTNRFDGWIDELRVGDTTFGASRAKAEYLNITSSGFLTLNAFENRPNTTYETRTGRIGFAKSTYFVNEGQGTFQIEVERIGKNEGNISANILISGNAIAGTDYNMVTSTIDFTDKESSKLEPKLTPSYGRGHQ